MKGRVCIVSDGTAKGSRVTLDGEVLENVFRVEFDLTAGEPAHVTLHLLDGELRFEADVTEESA